jgi:hypothetical protein
LETNRCGKALVAVGACLTLLVIAVLITQVLLYKKLRGNIYEAIRAETEGLRAGVEGLGEEVRELSAKADRYGRTIEEAAPRGGSVAAGNEEKEFHDIVIKKIIHDYIREGLGYFEKQEYLKARDLFSRALTLRRGDTTVQFYHIYSRYLGAADAAFTAGERESILAGIGELERIGYREDERLGFSGEEMRRKAAEMAYNVGEQAKRAGRGGM